MFTQHERELLVGDAGDGGASDLISNWLGWLSEVDIEPVERMMRLSTRMNLADDLLLYRDKISMAVSLEARAPMLDIELVNFVESLPLAYRIALSVQRLCISEWRKTIFLLALYIGKRKGFRYRSAIARWSRGIWKDWIAEKLLDAGQPHLKFIRRDSLQKMWWQHLRKQPDRSRQIFALLMLELWCEQQ